MTPTFEIGEKARRVVVGHPTKSIPVRIIEVTDSHYIAVPAMSDELNEKASTFLKGFGGDLSLVRFTFDKQTLLMIPTPITGPTKLEKL